MGPNGDPQKDLKGVPFGPQILDSQMGPNVIFLEIQTFVFLKSSHKIHWGPYGSIWEVRILDPAWGPLGPGDRVHWGPYIGSTWNLHRVHLGPYIGPTWDPTWGPLGTLHGIHVGTMGPRDRPRDVGPVGCSLVRACCR